MNLRKARDAFIAALGLLTRLPIPARGGESDGAPAWFPAVGLVIGGCLALTAGLAALVGQDLLAGWLVLLIWMGVTGLLHLDGLADLADGLGAAHAVRGDPEARRAALLAAMRDAHLGAFGAAAMLMLLAGKLAAASALVGGSAWGVWLLVPAWARWGALCWAAWLPPLSDSGMGAWLAGRGSAANCWRWGMLLAALSFWLAPALLAAPLLVWGWGFWLRRKAGGMNGDALGAGIETTELALLALAAV
ncbi:MAG: adenosylcobinamide-GDP ribazoletransferase [Mariprofundaceae bacterium]